MAYSALLDACVLFPAALRDTLLRVAEAGMFRPRWTARILDELRSSILERYSDLSPDGFDPTLEAMREAFEDAEIEGYESLVDLMTNAPSDRHVLAAAVAGRVDVIVTDNVGDFPPSACEPLGVDVQTPDEFLTHALHLDVDLLLDTLRQQAADKEKPPLTIDDLLVSLDRTVPDFAAACRQFLEQT